MPRSSTPAKPQSRKRGTGARSRRPKGVQDFSWIQGLASPYLEGYRPSAVSRGSLRGYRFSAPPKTAAAKNSGFFLGYVVERKGYEFLSAAPPECIIFAFIESPGSPRYRDLVTREDSLLRKTAEYIGWLTHRPPRFRFFDDLAVTLVRHFSMRAWPKAKHAHYSRNFFIETLAWLVRSGLVAKLRGRATAAEVDRR